MSALVVAIPLIMLAGAALLGAMALLKTRGALIPDRLVSLIACGTSASAFVLTVIAFVKVKGERLVVTGHEWIAAGGFSVDMTLAVDNFTLVMLSVVTGVGTLIHIYSTGYMKGDGGYCRYFAYLNLFMFFMLTLIMSENLLLLFVGWEGVGLCSYLLIGFWWSDIEKARAGMKAFIVNRIGDAGFILGMILVYQTANTLSLSGLRDFVHDNPDAFLQGSGFFGVSLATASCMLLFLGATGKSAQIPLFVWLPDAMAGPTPVSALIHAATMVTAGVYVLGRLDFLFAASDTARIVVSLVGALTAFLAATIALVQTDIKKVLAYSTISQLGYMFIAVGLGAVPVAVFHLVTHAFFKACLFLGSGSVIHAMNGEQDMRKMGGLRKRMPWTFATMLVAAIAMAGIPPLAGFFSKDEILWVAFSSNLGTGWFLWSLGILAAVCTAFYMGRLILMTFTGSCRADEETKAHLHESPKSMTGVLAVLALGSALIGFLGVPHFLGGHNVFGAFVGEALGDGYGAGVAHGKVSVELSLAVFSVMIAMSGLYAAWRLYKVDPQLPDDLAKRQPDLHKLLIDKYRVDEAYDASVVQPLLNVSEKTFFRFLDRRVIDRSIDRIAGLSGWVSERLALAQSGSVRTYIAVMIGGLLLIMLSLLA